MTSFLALMLSSVEGSLVTVDLKAETAGTTADIELKDGVALSNAGFLAAANGGVALPLNVFTVPSTDKRICSQY